VVAVTLASMTVPVAGADQLASDRAEASYLAARIAALGQREAALGEQYDAGVATLGQAKARVSSAARALAQAKVEQGRTLTLLQQDAIEAYVGGGPQMALNGSSLNNNVNDSLLRQELAQTFASEQTDALDGYRLAQANASAAEARLVLARDADARQVAGLANDRAQVQAAQDQLVSLEQQVKGRIAALVAEIQRQALLAEERAEAARLARERAEAAAAAAAAAARARAEAAAAAAEAAREAAARQLAERAAAARAAAMQAAGARRAALQAASNADQTAQLDGATAGTTAPAVTAPAVTPADTTVTTQAPQLPGVSAAAAAAVSAAESRVGDPYVWGDAGPGAFDCSGLVMWAYAQAGVYLPHFSGAQYDDTIHIPMSDLEPGDLVFPADPGEHVAIYVGNGEVVQAPYTGANVDVVPLTPFFVMASRVG